MRMRPRHRRWLRRWRDGLQQNSFVYGIGIKGPWHVISPSWSGAMLEVESIGGPALIDIGIGWIGSEQVIVANLPTPFAGHIPVADIFEQRLSARWAMPPDATGLLTVDGTTLYLDPLRDGARWIAPSGE